MLLEALHTYRRTGQLVGFCRWKNGRGLLFGRVLDVDEHRVRFGLVDALGAFDEEYVVNMRDLTRLEASPDYVKRLELFARFDPPMKEREGRRRRRARRSRSGSRRRASRGSVCA